MNGTMYHLFVTKQQR